MNTPPHVTIILLNWNGFQDTTACLESLEALDYPAYAVLVMDNASTDGSVERLRAQFPLLRIVVNEGNLGFAAGNNAGIRIALAEKEHATDYVWLLNNDTVTAPNALSALVAAAEAPSIGAAGPKIYFGFPSAKIWFAGARFRRRLGQAVMLGYGEADDGVCWEKVRDTDWITGCAMLIKTDVLRTVGLLDDDFFYGMEDLDFGLRVRAAGLRCIVAPKARVWHKVSASSGGAGSPLVMYHACRNRLLAMKKHGRPADWPLFLVHFVLSQLVQTFLLSRLRRMPPAVFDAAWLGTRDFLRGERGPMPQYVQARLSRRSAGRPAK